MKDIRKTQSSLYDRDKAKAASSKRKSKKKKRRMGLIYTLLFGLILISGTTLTFTVFFIIEDIKIEGDSGYTSDQILEASGISVSQNMFRISIKKSEEYLERALPYIEEAKIKRKLPSTVIITVKKATAAGAIKTDSGYIKINRNGKILEELQGEIPSNITTIKGIDVSEYNVGQTVHEDSDEHLELFRKVYESAENNRIQSITMIDVSDKLDLRIYCENRITVKLGSAVRLDEKFEFIGKIFDEGLPDNGKWILDASNDGEVRRLRDKITENVSSSTSEETSVSSQISSSAEAS